jgi:hypothetical protein
MNRGTSCARLLRWLLAATAWSLLVQQCAASIGDRLPDFRECVKVRVFTFVTGTSAKVPQVCKQANCESGHSPLREYEKCPMNKA